MLSQSDSGPTGYEFKKIAENIWIGTSTSEPNWFPLTDFKALTATPCSVDITPSWGSEKPETSRYKNEFALNSTLDQNFQTW